MAAVARHRHRPPRAGWDHRRRWLTAGVIKAPGGGANGGDGERATARTEARNRRKRRPCCGGRWRRARPRPTDVPSGQGAPPAAAPPPPPQFQFAPIPLPDGMAAPLAVPLGGVPHGLFG